MSTKTSFLALKTLIPSPFLPDVALAKAGEGRGPGRGLCTWFILLALFSSFPIKGAAREPYHLPIPPVLESIDALEQVTGQDFVTRDGEIFDYLEDTKYGGWDRDESVAGKIATIVDVGEGAVGAAPASSVEMPNPPDPPAGGIPLRQLPTMLPYPLDPLDGLPGREGYWDGNIQSGMAARDDYNFKYPNGAEGYALAQNLQTDLCVLPPLVEDSCNTEKDCLMVSDILNNEWRYPVCRISECWAGMYAYACAIKWKWVVVDAATGYGHWEQDGVDEATCDSWLYAWDVYTTEDTNATLNGSTVHPQTECNSCPILDGYAPARASLLPGFATCPVWNGWITFGCSMGQALPKVGKYAGEKFICTTEPEGDAIWPANWVDDDGNSHEDTAFCPNSGGGQATNAHALSSPYGWVWMDEGQSGIELPAQCKQYWVKEDTEYPNVTSCGVEDHIGLVGAAAYTKNDSTPGAECRCRTEGCRISERTSPKNGTEYNSFFRRYQGTYTRSPLPVPPIVQTVDEEVDEITTKEGQIGCYGWYHEFDPLQQMPVTTDWRCMIDMYGEDEDESLKDQMLKSHDLRGEYGQISIDRDPAIDEYQRYGGDPIARGAFDEDEDAWYLKLGGGFSFINEKLFDKKMGKDISLALLKPDTAEMRMEHLMSASGSNNSYGIDPEAPKYVRAFDDAVTNDTGSLRPIVEWWQKEETKANTLFSPPIVRLLLPATWAVSIDPLDPLFTPKRVPHPNLLTRTDALEVQLRAHEDLMGEVAAYIERSILLNVEQEPVPVVVPMGSPTELRAIAESWCTWWIGYYNRNIPDPQSDDRIDNCDDAPPEILTLIERLELYADRIEDTRALRGELAYYLSQVLKSQANIVLPIAGWINENLTIYRNFLLERERIFDLLQPWQVVQQTYQKFHDAMNFPWGMNHRFTIPVYSLIDPFFPVRGYLMGKVDGSIDSTCPADGSIEWPLCLPVLHGIQRSTDFVFDFSMLNITAAGTIAVPVLDPIQIKLNIETLHPPSIEEYPGAVPVLPDLPSVPYIQNAMRGALTSVPLNNVQVLSQPSVISSPPLTTGGATIETLYGELIQIFHMVYVMTYGTEEGTGGFPGYEDFWTSLVHLKDDETGEVYYWCPLLATWPCVHVEMDLLERFTRIGSRPAVLLKEDYDSHGSPRTDPTTCPPDDHVCLFLNGQARSPKEGWKVNAPTIQGEFIDAIRAAVRDLTLPQPIGNVSSSAMPRYEATPSDLVESMKIVPPRVDLRSTLPNLPLSH